MLANNLHPKFWGTCSLLCSDFCPINHYWLVAKWHPPIVYTSSTHSSANTKLILRTQAWKRRSFHMTSLPKFKPQFITSTFKVMSSESSDAFTLIQWWCHPQNFFHTGLFDIDTFDLPNWCSYGVKSFGMWYCSLPPGPGLTSHSFLTAFLLLSLYRFHFCCAALISFDLDHLWYVV